MKHSIRGRRMLEMLWLTATLRSPGMFTPRRTCKSPVPEHNLVYDGGQRFGPDYTHGIRVNRNLHTILATCWVDVLWVNGRFALEFSRTMRISSAQTGIVYKDKDEFIARRLSQKIMQWRLRREYLRIFKSCIETNRCTC
jgi:hypothetical protein